MRERLLFIPAFSVKGLRSAWSWAGPANSVLRFFALLHRRRRPRSDPSHPGSVGNNPPAGSRGPRTDSTQGPAPGPPPPSAVFYFFNGGPPVAGQLFHRNGQIRDLSRQQHGLDGLGRCYALEFFLQGRRLQIRVHTAGQQDLDVGFLCQAFELLDSAVLGDGASAGLLRGIPYICGVHQSNDQEQLCIPGLK